MKYCGYLMRKTKWAIVTRAELGFLKEQAREASDWAIKCESDIGALKAEDRKKLERIARALGFRQEWVATGYGGPLSGVSVWASLNGERKIALTWDMVFDVLEGKTR